MFGLGVFELLLLLGVLALSAGVVVTMVALIVTQNRRR